MSRKDLPKQLLRFIQRPGDRKARALLELADRRLDGLIDAERRWICTAEQYRGAVRELLPSYTDERVLGEPAARDTVNAVGLAAAILSKEDKDAIFCVLTADHVIEPADVFRDRMDLGFRMVENDPRRFVTFSIKPTYPATGFGYVERGAPVRDPAKGKRPAIDGSVEGASHVVRFVEKPDRARAEVYVESGEYGWNSGMFVWKASTFLEALERFKPESHEGLMKIQKAWGTKKYKGVLEEIYPTLPKISVDYAVMEPAAKEASSKGAKGGKDDERLSVCTVQMDLQWLDVGSWPAYMETIAGDASGNRVAGEGEVVMQGCRQCLGVASKGHTLALLGLSGVVVVQTPDATLVMPADKAEELKAIHAQLQDGLK